MNTVLVTGASGFVGRHLCRHLVFRGFRVVGTARHVPNESDLSQVRWQTLGDISSRSEIAPLMQDVDWVVHLAARAHVMTETSRDPLADFLNSNLGGTDVVATCAASAGVKRLLFLSTIKVLGEATAGAPFRETDEPRPVGPYAVSKLRAEKRLAEISRESDMETVVIRPPLVYGPGVRGNFLRLLRLAAGGLPMPLGSIANARSMISVANLCDVILACLLHPGAAGRHFLVSDGEDVSTSQLLRMLAAGMGRRARLLPVPVSLLRMLGVMSGRSAEVSRLCDSLRLDISPTQEALKWSPPQSLGAGIAAVAGWYHGLRQNRDV